MADEVAPPPPYDDAPNAPVIYFDIVGANGIMNGAVQIEIAQRILVPTAGSDEVSVKFVTSGRIRCSPAAAQFLINALQNSLAMMAQSQPQTAVAPNALN